MVFLSTIILTFWPKIRKQIIVIFFYHHYNANILKCSKSFIIFAHFHFIKPKKSKYTLVYNKHLQIYEIEKNDVDTPTYYTSSYGIRLKRGNISWLGSFTDISRYIFHRTMPEGSTRDEIYGAYCVR